VNLRKTDGEMNILHVFLNIKKRQNVHFFRSFAHKNRILVLLDSEFYVYQILSNKMVKKDKDIKHEHSHLSKYILCPDAWKVN